MVREKWGILGARNSHLAFREDGRGKHRLPHLSNKELERRLSKLEQELAGITARIRELENHQARTEFLERIRDNNEIVMDPSAMLGEKIMREFALLVRQETKLKGRISHIRQFLEKS